MPMRKPLVLVILLVVFIGGFYLWWRNGTSAVNPKDTSEKVFVIPQGEAIRNVGNSLKKEGLIKDPVVFFLFLKKNGLDRNIQAGSFKLSPSMNLAQIMDTLGHGSVDAWITIPEGYRSEEIAEVLAQNVETYDDSWVAALKEEEGYLFPDSYLIPKNADVATVISILRNNFNAKIDTIGLSSDDPRLNDIVITASLIEREALRDDEKPMIASVISNRLEDGMSLDIDATLQYAKGKSSNGKWWTVPTGEDREINSLYNTYRNPGLPPTPIANPGIEAIKAALNPDTTPYYYYIHDPKGNVHFARTLDQHNANVAKYLR